MHGMVERIQFLKHSIWFVVRVMVRVAFAGLLIGVPHL